MATRVFAHDANPAVDPWLYKLSVTRAKEDVVDTFLGRFITLQDGRRAVQLYPNEEVQHELAARNALVFKSRVLGKIKHPPSLHYSIPACGDHRIAWMNRFFDMPNHL